jgi:hypothetical protein
MQQWQEKVGLVLKPPASPQEAILHWEMRTKLSGLKEPEARLSWLERFGSDPLIASAIWPDRQAYRTCPIASVPC